MDKLTETLGFDWKLLIPVLAIELILVIVALTDLIRIDKNRVKGVKWVWAIVIIGFQMFGPIAYFVAGRRND
ncbi:MAG: PLD nuclease N-terminal domain-containing protein [Gorillibacterium sp.]|nr:PLD nuclease N-terminal domain-containing protein [Gorillibacterium sp.]